MRDRANYLRPGLPPPSDEGAAALLRTRGGRRVALRGVRIHVALRDLLCETEVIQTYQNDGRVNIEAVYTFPLPLDAVLLAVEVRLAGKVLLARVVEREAAQTQYENAMVDGDSALLLEQHGNGLYTLNLGNLLAGETAEICLRYAALLDWSSETLRVMIPTALAPRYGVPTALQPHEAPQYSLHAQYPLELAVDVTGALRHATLECASHAAIIERTPEGARLRLAAGAVMDRDVVINLRAASAACSAATLYPDGSGQVALVSLRPEIAAPAPASARSIKIVVDCSGSMNGDSITQARHALREVLKQLRPADEFNIVAFGSAQKRLFTRQQRANATALGHAAVFVDALAADMGGTEMEAALARAMALEGTAAQADILLISDGEVWDHESIAALAVKTQHRIFAIGVGSAVAEGVVRELAMATQGACELVAPRENIAAAIVRQFRRIYQPYAVAATVAWPGIPMWQHPPAIGAVFGGDALHVMAGFAGPVAGEAVLDLRFADGTATQQRIRLAAACATQGVAPTAPRLAAARRLQSLDEDAARELALQYQLLSPYTACFVLAERDAKAPDLPQLQVTPHMLAAGWGGAGTVLSSAEMTLDAPTVMRRSSHRPMAPDSDSVEPTLSASVAGSGGPRRAYTAQATAPRTFVEKLNAHFGARPAGPAFPATIAELAAFGLPDTVAASLRHFRDTGWTEQTVVAGFLQVFARQLSTAPLSRAATRAIAHAAKRAAPAAVLLEALAACLSRLTAEAWDWQTPAGVASAQESANDASAARDDGVLDIPAFLRKQAD